MLMAMYALNALTPGCSWMLWNLTLQGGLEMAAAGQMCSGFACSTSVIYTEMMGSL